MKRDLDDEWSELAGAGDAEPLPPKTGMLSPATPVIQATRRVDGCVRQNHVQDVLDVMDALELDFMPLVEDFDGGQVRGIVTRRELARVLKRFGSRARVGRAHPVMLPKIPDDTPIGKVGGVVGNAEAYVVTQRDGRVVGIYEPAHAEAPRWETNR